MNEMQKKADEIVEDAIPLGDAASKLLTALVNEETAVRGYLVSGDESFLEPYNMGKEMIEENLGIINSRLDGHPIMAELIKEAIPKINAVEEYFQSQIDLVKSGRIEEARKNVGNGKQLFDSFRETFTKIDEDVIKLTNDAWNGSKDAKQNAQILLIIFGLAAVGGTIIIASLLIKIISKPVTIVSNTLKQLADGDLTMEELKVRSEDEIGVLTRSINATAISLRELIAKISEASSQIAASAEELTASAEESTTAASQVAASTQEAAAGANEQSKKVEEVISSVQEMAASIEGINDSSKEMLQLSINASSASGQGSELLNEVVNEMKDISTSSEETSQIILNLDKKSQEIGNIVAIITDITAQTNLLALNAAIEAARAGEMGKGFAVVAEEVRKLAEQSKTSAQEITNLINAVQSETSRAVVSMKKEAEKVETGLERAYKVNEAFKTIEKDIVSVTDRVQEVTASLEEMNVASNEVIKLVEAVGEKALLAAQSSQDNSASVEEQLATMEEIASSAQALSNLAENLGTLMSRFKI
jgi:Methyl-accepting chemotaxis protein